MQNGQIREAFQTLGRWYKHRSNQALPLSHAEMSEVESDYGRLYQAEHIEDDLFHLHVQDTDDNDIFQRTLVPDEVPEEPEIRAAAKRLRTNKAAGPT